MKPAAARVTLFGAMSVLFFAGAYSIPTIFELFSRTLPANYRAIARESLGHGEYADAEAIARKRLAQTSYDFDAYYLLAEALMRQGRQQEAADTLKMLSANALTARYKGIAAVGYDEAQMLGMLADALAKEGKATEAGEMTRAAMDAGANIATSNEPVKNGKADPHAWAARANTLMKRTDVTTLPTELMRDPSRDAAVIRALWTEIRDHQTSEAEDILRDALDDFPQDPTVKMALANHLQRNHRCTTECEELMAGVRQTTGARVISGSAFALPTGATATDDALLLGRNGEAKVQIQTGAFRVTSLLLNASGTPALGMFPIVSISSGGTELTRLYIDNPQPRLYDLELWPQGAPKSLDLSIKFLNDAYDPASKADRNVRLEHLMLH